VTMVQAETTAQRSPFPRGRSLPRPERTATPAPPAVPRATRSSAQYHGKHSPGLCRVSTRKGDTLALRQFSLRRISAVGAASREADQFHSYSEPLWDRENSWDHTAQNPGSGAHGIPQSLPGDTMASHGDDWRTNPAAQIS